MATASPLSSQTIITAGCYVTWKRDQAFRVSHEPQMSRFFKEYGYGPFLVREMRGEGTMYDFAVIGTPKGDRSINIYYLELVQTSLNPSEIATD